MRKEVWNIVMELKRQGWRYRLNKHIVLYSPDLKVPPIVIGCTPSDNRSLDNARAFIRKHGGKV